MANPGPPGRLGPGGAGKGYATKGRSGKGRPNRPRSGNADNPRPASIRTVAGALGDVPNLWLRPGHVQPVWAGHPWVFAQAVARVEEGAEPGSEVQVRDAEGKPLGRGLYSPKSALAVRLYTRDEHPVDAALFRARIARARTHRQQLGLPGEATTGFRLVHAEGDGLPGVIVDHFGADLAVQWGSIGIQLRQEALLDALQAEFQPRAIIDRTSDGIARLEGFVPNKGVVRGDTTLTELEFLERGFSYRIPLTLGQKTGFYFDQRPLRERVEQLAAGRRVLDTYTFTGSLALSAWRGGARHVVGVDSSADALQIAARHAQNAGAKVAFEHADALEFLGQVGAGGERFDLVICDPPKLAQSRKGREGAGGMMRHVAARGISATAEGGLFVISSCSSAVGVPELMRAVALGARDCGRELRVLERLFQGADHPVPAAFPEGLYLSTLVCQLD
jgi:23S rRNA (cytosine1962-C5)-methyltransferase